MMRIQINPYHPASGINQTPSGDMKFVPIVSRVFPGVGLTVGLIEKRGGLWKKAHASMDVGEGKREAEGMPAIMDMLHRLSDTPPIVILPLHEGYVAVFGRSGRPVMRMLDTGAGWRLRQFEPHDSILFDDIHAAIAAAEARL